VAINSTLVKFYIQVVSNLLNMFLLIMMVDLLWSKCSNYAVKLKKTMRRSQCSFKNTHNIVSINSTLVKFYIQVVSNLLNMFLLIMLVDLLWPKCSNYAVMLKKWDIVSIVTKISIIQWQLILPWWNFISK
jgi:hypothetical protein